MPDVTQASRGLETERSKTNTLEAPALKQRCTRVRTTRGSVVAFTSGGVHPMLGFTTTTCPGLTQAPISPMRSIAAPPPSRSPRLWRSPLHRLPPSCSRGSLYRKRGTRWRRARLSGTRCTPWRIAPVAPVSRNRPCARSARRPPRPGRLYHARGSRGVERIGSHGKGVQVGVAQLQVPKVGDPLIEKLPIRAGEVT